MKQNMTPTSPAQEQRPNIVFILTDQWRGDCLSATGHPVVETPNLDMLAAKGTVFTSAYSSCPSCVAARASMFTGLRPTSHHRLGYRDRVPWRYETTLASELRKAGYQTHCVGKTHFFPQRNHLGFDTLDSYEAWQNHDGRYVNDYHVWLKEMSGGRYMERDHGVDSNSWFARPSHLPEELHNNTWVVTKGVEFLKRRDPSCPFFLNLSFHRPHPPIDPPQAYYDMYKDRELPPVPVGDWAERHDIPADNINAWHGRITPSFLDNARRAYYAQIAHIDNQIGRFLIELGSAKAGPTWILFTSDHGEMLGDHHMFRKTYAYEGSAKIPFILRPPKGSTVHTCAAPVLQEDIMPSLLEAAGIPIPDCVEGKSLLSLMESGSASWRDYLHGEHSPCYGTDLGMQYLTNGKEKYIWYTSTGEEQLFDLEADPEERRNLAGSLEHQSRLETWRNRLIAELAPRHEDGLSDGKRLISGKSLPSVRPCLLDNLA